MDPELQLDSQIKAVVRNSFFRLRQLAKIKPLLNSDLFETVIHAFVTSRLDYCNALYMGISASSLARLQMVQNAAARLLTFTRKYEHISPILSCSTGCPFNRGFILKLFYLLCPFFRGFILKLFYLLSKPSMAWPALPL